MGRGQRRIRRPYHTAGNRTERRSRDSHSPVALPSPASLRTRDCSAVRVPALATRLGDPTEAAGIRWAAEHGADVICCAWGPQNPTPESGRLPEHTRRAIDWAVTHGRDGKGCVVVFSSGNDGSDVALNGYASHPDVIAVGACNCHGQRPAYSGWGDALWCVVPSNDPRDPIGADQTYDTTTPIGSFAPRRDVLHRRFRLYLGGLCHRRRRVRADSLGRTRASPGTRCVT